MFRPRAGRVDLVSYPSLSRRNAPVANELTDRILSHPAFRRNAQRNHAIGQPGSLQITLPDQSSTFRPAPLISQLGCSYASSLDSPVIRHLRHALTTSKSRSTCPGNRHETPSASAIPHPSRRSRTSAPYPCSAAMSDRLAGTAGSAPIRRTSSRLAGPVRSNRSMERPYRSRQPRPHPAPPNRSTHP